MGGNALQRFPVNIEGEVAQIGTANELAIALDVLQGNHDRMVLEQLGPHLAEIIATPGGFMTTMKSLEPVNQVLLVECIGPKLAGVLQKATYLASTLATLATPEVKEAILRVLGTKGLRALVITANDLAGVLHWVFGKSDQAVLDLLGADYVRSIIRTGDDLGRVFSALEADTQNVLLEQLGFAHIVDIVRDGRELAYVLRALPPAFSARLVAQYSRERLVTLIGNAGDWQYLWARLEPEEQVLIQQKLGGK